MKRHLLLGLALAGTLIASAQSDYQPLKSSGPVPSDFTDSYKKKLSDASIRSRKGKSKRSRRDRIQDENFYEQNEFFVDRRMQSGLVIYGDPITQYLNRIVDHILKDQPELREEIRVYTVKNTSFNAYATDNGILFVNIGLIAQLETEAQLAFILSHEIAHYVERHVKNRHMEKIKFDKQSRYLYGDDLDDKVEELLGYTKEQELEADEKGYLDFFKSTGYSQEAPVELIDVMMYSYLPFDEIPFDHTVMTPEGMNIHPDLLLQDTKGITAVEDYDDEKSTHPNLKTRRAELVKLTKNEKGGDDFIISEKEFKDSQNLARYEMTRSFLVEVSPYQAIYNAFLLQLKDQDDQFLRRSIVQSVYTASVYKNYYKIDKIIPDVDDIEGESQQVANILTHMEPKDMNVMAVLMTYNYLKDHPEDKVMKRIFQDALFELAHHHELTLEDFETERPVEENDSTATEEIAEEEAEEPKNGKLSKVQRLKKAKEAQKVIGWEYAFVDALKDTMFVNEFERQIKDYEEWLDNAPTLDGEPISFADTRDPESNYNNDRNDYEFPERAKNIGGADVSTVFIITPPYLRVDGRKGKTSFEETDEGWNNYKKNLQEMAKQAGVDFTFFDYKSFRKVADGEEDTYFNEIQALQEWLEERQTHDQVYLVQASNYTIQPIKEKYGVDHMVYTGNISIRLQKFGSGSNTTALIAMVLNPLYVPGAIWKIAQQNYASYQFFFLYDLENGNKMYSSVNGYKSKDYNYLMRSQLYKNFLYVKSPKKMKK